jgi:putative oxidoreductase
MLMSMSATSRASSSRSPSSTAEASRDRVGLAPDAQDLPEPTCIGAVMIPNRALTGAPSPRPTSDRPRPSDPPLDRNGEHPDGPCGAQRGGHGVEGTAGAFEQTGFQPGRVNAVAAGAAETGGGAMIALGLGTPVAGSVAAGTMIAAASVHTSNGFFAASGGYEYPALLGPSAAALSLTGPGAWSVDALLGHRFDRAWMAGTGLLASSAPSAVLVWRHRRRRAAGGARSPGRCRQSPDTGSSTRTRRGSIADRSRPSGSRSAHRPCR